MFNSIKSTIYAAIDCFTLNIINWNKYWAFIVYRLIIYQTPYVIIICFFLFIRWNWGMTS